MTTPAATAPLNPRPGAPDDGAPPHGASEYVLLHCRLLTSNVTTLNVHPLTDADVTLSPANDTDMAMPAMPVVMPVWNVPAAHAQLALVDADFTAVPFRT